MIVNDDSGNVNKFEASLTDDAIVVYNHHMFMVQATALLATGNTQGGSITVLLTSCLTGLY